jgi:hypothetical protein
MPRDRTICWSLCIGQQIDRMAQALVKRRLKLRQDWYPKFFGCLVLSNSEALLHKWVRDSLVDTSVVAGGHEQLDTYEVQDPALAFVP